MTKTERQILGPCPKCDEPQPTHARMTAERFLRFTGALIYWCSRCGEAHVAERADLSLKRDAA